MSSIKFGTSGWRGWIGREVTFENVRRAAQAVAKYLLGQERKKPPEVLVGGDTRFLSEKFQEAAAEVLCGNGLRVRWCRKPVPTPAVSFSILRRGLAGGLNITASHNPAIYSGIKFTPSWGGPALPAEVQAIERFASSGEPIRRMPLAEARRRKLLTEEDPRPAYLKRLLDLVDAAAIRRARISVGADVLFGAAAEYLPEALQRLGCRVEVFHAQRDPRFGGRRPEPCPESLPELREEVKKGRLRCGVAVDADADRFGLVDPGGEFVEPNLFLAVLLDHLIRTRKWKDGVVVRSIMTTHLLDAVARSAGLTVKKTPVGFKFIGEAMVHAEPGERFRMGGEESGGLAIQGHLPEKDGILACLLAVEVWASRRKPFRDLLAEIFRRVGPLYSRRIDLTLPGPLIPVARAFLSGPPPSRMAGVPVEKVQDLDGRKIFLADGSWVGIRFSGTEPVVRVYAESPQESRTRRLLEEVRTQLTKNG